MGFIFFCGCPEKEMFYDPEIAESSRIWPFSFFLVSF